VQDRLLASGEMVYVFTTTTTPAKARALPAALRDLLEAHARNEAMLRVQLGSWAEWGEAARAVRTAVFIREQGIPAELEWDDDDAICRHAVVFNRLGMPVACARLLPDGHIGRVAVVQAMRGSQAGRLVMQSLMLEARTAGHSHAEISAQLAVLGFYRRLGFSSVGEPYVEAGHCAHPHACRVELNVAGGERVVVAAASVIHNSREISDCVRREMQMCAAASVRSGVVRQRLAIDGQAVSHQLSDRFAAKTGNAIGQIIRIGEVAVMFALSQNLLDARDAQSLDAFQFRLACRVHFGCR
jgi:Predicted acyltransferase